ncbi:MAG: hypothetical protein U0N26_08280 [Faecalibacterium prausnitzii]
MVKRNGETVEYQVALNIPHLRKKINKTCANRPVSCVNDKKTMKNAGFCFSGLDMVYWKRKKPPTRREKGETET